MNPSTPANTVKKLESMATLLDELVTALGPTGTEHRDFSITQLVKNMALGDHTRQYAQVFMDLGILKRDGPEYGTPANGMTPGRHYHYTLMVSPDEAQRLFEIWANDESNRATAARADAAVKGGAARHANHVAKSKEAPAVSAADDFVNDPEPHLDLDAMEAEIRKVLAEPDDTVAIVGEDKPAGLAAKVDAGTIAKLRSTRKDESGALVQAARDYLNRASTASTIVGDMERSAKAAGLSFDVEAVKAMFVVEQDERLETVALLLPFIDEQEAKLARQKATIEAYIEKTRLFDQLKRDYEALKKANERRIAGQVAQAQTASTH